VLPGPDRRPADGDLKRLGAALGALLLLGVLALGLLAFHRDHGTARQPGHSLAGVAMPATLPGSVPVRPLRIVLILGPGLSSTEARREVRVLGRWLGRHTNHRTRLTVIDVPNRSSTGPLGWRRWGHLGGGRFASLAADLHEGVAAGEGAALIIAFGRRAITAPGAASLHLIDRRGATLPSTVALRVGGRLSQRIDIARPRTLAATIARGIVSLSHLRER
jgi:hypothetical protein